MKYKITHSTSYAYSSPVSVCHNLVMMTPREDPRVHCLSHRLRIRPTPQVSGRRYDCFGNHVHSFSIEESHRKLTVMATSRVSVEQFELPAPESTPAWESLASDEAAQRDPSWLNVAPFRFDSPRVQRSTEFADYARTAFTPSRSVLAAVLDLTATIHSDFAYDKQATLVDTPTEEAFRLRRGVCQDFAHVQIACLRSLGIPTRYVSGYLRTLPEAGKERLVGADQSHAWLSVYCGTAGWIDVDPTNNCVCSTDHIPVAWGRDFGDVVPIKGVFLGGGEHILSVSVDVLPLEKVD
ncbi:MAG: transglutaminase family protein [Planctomycetales bacterium]|nr:transglutaminase family protein [Planctomycetales bacterium]